MQVNEDPRALVDREIGPAIDRPSRPLDSLGKATIESRLTRTWLITSSMWHEQRASPLFGTRRRDLGTLPRIERTRDSLERTRPTAMTSDTATSS